MVVTSAAAAWVQEQKGNTKCLVAFVAVQDNRLPTPPRLQCPNHKVSPFLKWIKQVSMKAWSLAKT